MGNAKALAGTLVMLTSMLGGVTASAQDYPSKPIRLIVPSTPGTTSDVTARILAPSLSNILGQPVVVENRAGAQMIAAFEYVARQMPADGYTLVAASPTNLVMLPLTVKNLRFDPLKDLPPVIGLVETRLALGSSATLPWKSFGEMVSHAKANPGKLNFGASSSSVRLPMEMIIRKAGLDIVHIPYTGGGAYLQALASGADIHMGFLSEASAFNLGERFRLLAVTGAKRNPKIPDVPTFGELGFRQIPGLPYSLNVRAGTPVPIMQKLFAAASQALQQPEVRALYEKNNFVIMNEGAETAARTLAEQAAIFGEVAGQVGLRPE